VFSEAALVRVLDSLRLNGSVAAPGFMDPEGYVMFHTASGVLFKATVQDDDLPKSELKT